MVNGSTTWSYDVGEPMTSIGDDVFTITATINGTFAFVTQLADNWDTLNENRYGPETEPTTLTSGVAGTLYRSSYAFSIDAGTYDIVVDLGSMTVTATSQNDDEGSNADDITTSSELDATVLAVIEQTATDNSGSVYFFNNTAGWENVYIYSWDSIGNCIDAGVKCSHISGTSLKSTQDGTSDIWYWINVDNYDYAGILFKAEEGAESDSWAAGQTANYIPKNGGFYNYVENNNTGTSYECAFYFYLDEETASYVSSSDYPEQDPSAITDIVGSETEEVVEVGRYNLLGQRLDAPQSGVNIIRYSNGTSKKVLAK